jgi:hypothetical protein
MGCRAPDELSKYRYDVYSFRFGLDGMAIDVRFPADAKGFFLYPL